MPRKTPRISAPEGEVPLFVGLTPNQVVAYNLARARAMRGWTQDQAAEALAPYLGTRWSKASLSQAERSVGGRFVRNFNADEIVAFARAFELPVTWFFLPPPPESSPGVPMRLATPDAQPFGEMVALLVDLVFGDDYQQALLSMRLDAFLDALGTGPLTKAQERVAGLVRARVEALVRHSFRDLGQWQTMLRGVANQLEDLERRAHGGLTIEEQAMTVDERMKRLRDLAPDAPEPWEESPTRAEPTPGDEEGGEE